MKFEMKTLLFLASSAVCGSATSLPLLSASQNDKLDQLSQNGKWWVQVGDDIVHQPHASSGLSQEVSNYFYAYGSEKALPAELLAAKVGGSGRAHIFHLPNGPAALIQQPSALNGRRAAVSSLLQLAHKKVLSNSRLFPDYQLSDDYQSPLSASGQETEKQVIAALTSDSLMAQLTSLVELPGDGGPPTRSYSNPAATKAAIDHIRGRFESYGYKTCMQSSKRGVAGVNNIVAYLPNQDNSAAEGSVILGGHYDSRPYDGKAPGAVDNGSGAAAVLSVAKAVADAGVKPKKPIFFVAFAGEEPGLWGSALFAEKLKYGAGAMSLAETDDNDASSEKLFSSLCTPQYTAFLHMKSESAKKRRASSSAAKKHYALVLDEVAWKSPNLGEDVVNFESYDWATDVLQELSQSAKTHHPDDLHVTHSSNPFGSDHMSFLDNGFQSVLSIHGDDEAYPNYHTSNDDLSNVNADLYTKIVHVNAGALLRLAGM